MGKISYTIYITHFFVISVMKALSSLLAKKLHFYQMIPMDSGAKLYIDFGNSLLANIYLALNIILVLLLADFLYRVVEKPCINFGKRKT